MQWPVLFTLLLATAAWAREPYLKLHDDTFIPDAVLQVTESNSQVGCIERTSVIVNGSVPGPELRFASGSVVWIRVYNDMPDNNLTMVSFRNGILRYHLIRLTYLALNSIGTDSQWQPPRSLTVRQQPANGPSHP